MTNFDVRVAEPEDIERVTGLLEASYPSLTAEAYEAFGLPAEALGLMTTAQPALLASGTFYVAETRDGHLIGCGGWTVGRPPDGEIEPGRAHVRHFATHPDFTRRGVARAIYRRCEEEARQAGVRELECHSLLNAEPFYAGQGFTRTEYLEIAMTPGVVVRCALMRKRID